MLTTADAARELGLEIRQVQNLCKSGVLRATRIGRDYLIDPEGIQAAKNRPGPGPRPKTTKKPVRKRRKEL